MKSVFGAIAAVIAAFVGLAIFERLVPLSVRRWYQKHIGTPVFSATCGFVPGWAVIETTGRRTGKLHRVPVGGGIADGSFWLVSAAGRRSHFLLNLEAHPSVRVKTRGRWHHGVAEICPSADLEPALRLAPINAMFIKMANDTSEMIPVRVDLSPKVNA